jgi:hypothetical protein
MRMSGVAVSLRIGEFKIEIYGSGDLDGELGKET